MTAYPQSLALWCISLHVLRFSHTHSLGWRPRHDTNRVLPSPSLLPLHTHGSLLPAPFGSSFPSAPSLLLPLACVHTCGFVEHINPCPSFSSSPVFPPLPWSGEIGLCCLQLTPPPPPQYWCCRVFWKGRQVFKSPEELPQRVRW